MEFTVRYKSDSVRRSTRTYRYSRERRVRVSYVGVIVLHKSRVPVAECRKINGALFEGKSLRQAIPDTRRLGDANKSTWEKEEQKRDGVQRLIKYRAKPCGVKVCRPTFRNAGYNSRKRFGI